MDGPINISRREILQMATRFPVLSFGASLIGSCDSSRAPRATPTPGNPSPVPSTPNDFDYLNLALNFAYLEGQFYSFAAKGTGLASGLLEGLGARGVVRGGSQVDFTDGLLRQHSREIAGHTEAHIVLLRSILGSIAVAQPEIDMSAAPTGPFTVFARAAAIVGPAEEFDPFASTNNFLMAAFLFADPIVTLHNGLVPHIRDDSIRSDLTGLLAAKAYHAGLVRTTVQRMTTPSSIPYVEETEGLSAVRDGFDGNMDLDQGVATIAGTANLVPTGAAGMVFARTPAQVLNIFYMSSISADRGGFFPAGVNGTIRTSGNG